ncbi:MAG: hypothetical protein QOH96_1511 [Blastocatellia bacterium]|nr:hypothetical protein [Blastocatellia bacterium]
MFQMKSSGRNKLLSELALIFSVGLLGFYANCFPLQLFPKLSLIVGSALVVAFAARRGPVFGGVAGAIAGSRTIWLWTQPFPLSLLLLAGEGAWIGYFCKRRGWRPLYAAITYWLLFGCWVNAGVQSFIFRDLLLTTSLSTFRSVFNGVVNALIGELLLILFSYISYLRGRTEEGFRVGLAATVGIIMVLAIGLTASFGVASASKSEAAQANERAQLETLAKAVSARRALNASVSGTYKSLAYLADLIRLQKIPLTDARQLDAMLSVLQGRQENLSGVYISDAAGRTIAVSASTFDGSSGASDSERRGFQQLPDPKHAVLARVFSVHKDEVSPTATIAVPILDDGNVPIGQITAWYKPKVFADLASRISSEQSHPKVVIIDSDSHIVADSDRDPANAQMDVTLADDPIFRAASEKVEGFKTVAAFKSAGGHIDESRSTSVAWSTYKELGWKVIVSMPMSPVEEALAWHNLELLEELLGLVLLALLVSNAFGNRLARPLVELESYALRLARGDLAARPSTGFVITREANLLRRAFSKMADELERSWREQRTLTMNAEIAAQQAQDRASHVAALNSLGQELSLTFDLPSICRAAHRYIKTQLEASGFLISLFDERDLYITTAFAWGDGREFDVSELPSIKLGLGEHSRCIRSRKPVLVDQFAKRSESNAVHVVGIDDDPRIPESVLYLPLISFDRVVGTLQVQGYSRSQFQTDDIERLMAVASQIAVSISNAKLFEQIRDAKGEWEKTFDSMSDGVFLFDEKATLIRANRAGAEMEGADFKSLIGKRCCEILATGSGQECFVGPAIKNGLRVVREIVTKRNSKAIQVTVEPVDSSGRVRGSICVARDITELRKAEEDARTQREFAAQLVEGAQEAIFTFDSRGRVTWSNQKFCELTGYSVNLESTFDVASLVHIDDLGGVVACVGRVFQGSNESYEARFIGSGGDARWFKTTFTPVKSHGKITSVLAVTRDVTDERDAAEQLERANKLAAVGQLAAGVAHDFNNLLVPILGRAQLLKRQISDPIFRSGLEVIEKAALDGAATVRRLQNFSRRHTGDKMEAVEVDDLLRDVIELTRTRWRDDALARGVRYDINLSFGEGGRVMASPSELREVFTNIIINALDAMPDGGQLSVKSRLEGVQVRITISDTGQGMPETVRKHIFEPFFSTKGHAGTGLGLAVSYGIIERHSGSINVDSTSGMGSTFTICLPLTNRAPVNVVPFKTDDGPRLRLLVVDDEDLVRMTLVETLESMNHEVISAASGREGLQRLSESSVDIVLTDLSMPDMDGWTFARHIRQRFPHLKTVLVTGYGGSEELEGEYATLVNSVIGKPFEYDEIAEVVERLSREIAPLQMV